MTVDNEDGYQGFEFDDNDGDDKMLKGTLRLMLKSQHCEPEPNRTPVKCNHQVLDITDFTNLITHRMALVALCDAGAC